MRDHRLDELLGPHADDVRRSRGQGVGGESGASGGRRGPCASLTSWSLRRASDSSTAPAARRRRRVVTVVTIVVGTALLAATLRVPHGSAWFSVLGLLVAATWTVGSFVSGPIPFQPDRDMAWRTFVGPVVVGVAAFGVFLVAYLVARHLPLVGPALDGVLATADAGPIASCWSSRSSTAPARSCSSAARSTPRSNRTVPPSPRPSCTSSSPRPPATSPSSSPPP